MPFFYIEVFMKSTIFRKILDQNSVVINVPPKETIRRLCAQNGFSYEEDHLNYSYHFYCNKRGKFIIDTYQRRRNGGSFSASHSEASFRTYHIMGEVLDEQGKSKINIYSIHNRLNTSVLLFDLLLDLIFTIPLYLISLVITAETSWKFFIILGGLVMISGGLFRLISDHNHHPKELGTMKEIAFRKVESAKRWNE